MQTRFNEVAVHREGTAPEGTQSLAVVTHEEAREGPISTTPQAVLDDLLANCRGAGFDVDDDLLKVELVTEELIAVAGGHVRRSDVTYDRVADSAKE